MTLTYLGAAVNGRALAQDAVYARLLGENFNCFYPENGFKPAAVAPIGHRDRNWAEADAVVAFARKHVASYRGHCIFWQCSVPKWLHGRTQDEAWRLMQHYIEELLGRYPDAIAWDVCNESFNDQGEPRNALRYIFGADYLLQAYKLVHEIALSAKLFYCDNQLLFPDKWRKICDILVELRFQAPIHGVAMQLHAGFPFYLNPQVLAATIKLFHTSGFEVHFPECVIWARPGIPGSEKLQAYYYKILLKACLDNDVSLLGFWAPFDVYPWAYDCSKQCHGGLWDINHHAKPILKWLTSYIAALE